MQLPFLGELSVYCGQKRTAVEKVGNFVRQKPLGAIGAVIALIVLVVAIFAPIIATDNQYKPEVERIFAAPGADAWLGGDELGRDVFSRLVYGARISLYVGILSSFIGSSIGLLVGVASAYFGGKVDLIVQRFVDGMMAFPALILAIAIMAALGSSLNNVVIALSINLHTQHPRESWRAQALAINEMDYILAARAVGAGSWRIILRHIIPNTFAVFIVIVTFHLGGAIIAEASLSFLGIGAPPSEPSWGVMLSKAAPNVRIQPWLGVFPGLAIALVVFSWNLLGDALRDVLDPRLRGTGGS